MRAKSMAGVAGCLLLSLGPAWAQGKLEIPVAGAQRSSVIHKHAGEGRPTIIVMHGAKGSGAQVAASSGFVQAAQARGFNAVFPDGVNNQWNDGREAGLSAADDVGFINALADRLAAEKIADVRRLYLAGISNGGMMAFTIACAGGGKFAGIGAIIANAPAGGCNPGKPMPLAMVNGTADPMVPYAGGGVGFNGGRGRVMAAEDSARAFARANNCASGPASTAMPDRDPGDGTRVTMLDWQGCKAPVRLYRVEGGGHQVPGGGLLPRLLGPGNNDISAANVIMDVFASR